MPRPADATYRLLVVGADAPDQLEPAVEAAVAGSDTTVEVDSIPQPAAVGNVDERVTAADCVVVAAERRPGVDALDDPTTPVVVLVEEFTLDHLHTSVTADDEAVLSRHALSTAPDAVAEHVVPVLADTAAPTAASDSAYEQIFDGVNDVITVHDTDTGEILRANEPYLELLGYESIEQVRELGIGGLSATEEGYTAEAGKQLIREAGQ